MRTLSTRAIAVLALLIALNFGGCVGTSAPRGWLPSVYDSREVAWSAWAELTLRKDVSENHIYGELIAIQEDTVIVLTAEGLTEISRDQLRRIKLSTYQSNHGALAAWATLGSVSTISHGVGLILSFPVWVIVGSVTTAGASSESDETCHRLQIIPPDDACWLELAKFARFPQGIPDTVDRSTLLAKAR